MTRSITTSDRRAKLDAMRHMLAGGGNFRDVRRGLDLSIRQMPRAMYLPTGMAKGQTKEPRR